MTNNEPCKGICSCSPRSSTGLARRDFLKAIAFSAAGAATAPWHSIAGPFTREDFQLLVPADKKLSPTWVKALAERGAPEVYTGEHLRRIGMPVGGIGAGQVYLGGDGKLWHWDVFNQHINTGSSGPHYAQPMAPASPFEQGFALKILHPAQPGSPARNLDGNGWEEISFRGEYPIGNVTFRDPGCPLQVELNCYSPFAPLETDDSSLPLVVLEYTVHNPGTEKVRAEMTGWLENAVCHQSKQSQSIFLKNRAGRRRGYSFVECSAEAAPMPARQERTDILFDDFERPDYGDWKATGTAFGSGPVAHNEAPAYQGALNQHGQRTVNTHAASPPGTVEHRDSAVGTLTSREFVIERDYIHFLIGGGSHKNRTCVNLLVDGAVVLSATGRSDNRMQHHSFRVSSWAGKTARLQAVDSETGPWGNIGLDYIVFSDTPTRPPGPLAEEPDFGSLVLCLLDRKGAPAADRNSPGTDFVSRPPGDKLIGSISRKLEIAPGKAATISWLIAWNFPNLKLDRLGDHGGRWYSQKFPRAIDVADYFMANRKRLSDSTRLWRDTWYDSSLPYWFLDRTFLNTSILATSTCFRLGNGRFYGWEGVGCCAGTCTHVWQYAQAVARLFPDLERSLREKVDYGVAMDGSGRMRFRGEHNDHWAVDGQCGVILRTYREHLVSTNDQFLHRVWPRARKALEFLIEQDTGSDGVLDGPQHNTLDTDWWGEIAWLSGMYLAALRAGEEMAREMGDDFFASQCRRIFETGRQRVVEGLFDGEYFINRVDPAKADTINSGTGCHIDQVFGQSWASQLDLGRILPPKETVSALKSLWLYNFTPDVGLYRKVMKPGRWYAMPGEAGLLMCTFPRKDWDYDRAKGKGPDWAAGYFNECMNGFEYQAAWHMIAEGLVQEGLAVTRAVHERYHGSRRNPWNEIECGDHYARSMASYGVYLAACGFSYNGPKGSLGFAPAIHPEQFKAAFTVAEGWGSYSQSQFPQRLTASVLMKHGQLRLVELSVRAANSVSSVQVTHAGKNLPATWETRDGKTVIRLKREVLLNTGQSLEAILA